MSGAERVGVNVHLYPSPFEHESRALRITGSLRKAGLFARILMIGVRPTDDLVPLQEIDETRAIVRLRAKPASGLAANAFRLLLWYARVFRYLRSIDVRCINCHSLSTLPLGVVLKIFHRARLIYDTHELETETMGSRGVRQWLAKLTERLLIPRAEAVCVVSEPIADWYSNSYRISPHVIRNVPALVHPEGGLQRTLLFNEKFGIPPDAPIYLYLGTFSRGRNIETLVEAFEAPPRGAHLICLGYGPLEQLVREAAGRSRHVHFHPAVAPNEVLRYTQAADVGISLIEPACLSYYFSLPNKFFEYLHAGVPVIVSDLPCTKSITAEHGCGWVSGQDVQSLRRTIEIITPAEIDAKRTGAAKARLHYTWQNEERLLLKIYSTTRTEPGTPNAP